MDVVAMVVVAAFVAWCALAWRRAREHRRRWDLGLCPECGYDPTGNVSGVCPECGTPIKRYPPAAD